MDMSPAPAPSSPAKLTRQQLKDQHEDELLDGLLSYLEHAGQMKLVVVDRPDRSQRNGQACDARVGPSIAIPTLAIEISSTDAFGDRRRDDDVFKKVVVPLTQDVDILAHLLCTVRLIVEPHSIPAGISHAVVTSALKQAVLDCAGNVPYGKSTQVTVATTPTFTVHIATGGSIGTPVFRVARAAPANLEAQRAGTIKERLEKKVSQLKIYRDQGLQTLLLLESDDLALTNSLLVKEAFDTAIPTVVDSDVFKSVILVETEGNPWVFSCLRTSAALSLPADELWTYDVVKKGPYK